MTWLARGAPKEAKDTGGTTVAVFLTAADGARAACGGRSRQTQHGSNYGASPLNIAACYDHTDAMRAACGRRKCALYFSIRPFHATIVNCHLAAATLLLDAGANVNALTRLGNTVLTCARTPTMRALLIARGGV
jgi:hypothetical protein